MAGVDARRERAKWSYHPVEVVVRSAIPGSDLAHRIAGGLSSSLEVGIVHHGPLAAVEGWGNESGAGAEIAANGQSSLYRRRGHLDLAQQRTLLTDLDVVVVDGDLDGEGVQVLELGAGDADLSGADERVAACVGEHRPVRVRPGGIPWFPADDLQGLVEVVEERLDGWLRSRPLLGLVHLDPGREGADLPSLLADRCAETFLAPPHLRSGLETVSSRWPEMEGLGAILSLQERSPEAGILSIRGDLPAPHRLDRLLQARDPFAVATAFRLPDTHLPDPSLSIWEPKSRARIFQFLAAGVSCPQRLLAQSRVRLLDP